MKPFSPLSVAEQLAAHLREEILCGRLRGTMPGVLHLARELGVSSKTTVDAVRLLQIDGLLEYRGAGRRNRIVAPQGSLERSLRIEMMLYEKSDLKSHYWVDLQHQLLESGHAASFNPRTLMDLGMNVARVRRLVEQSEADAWVIASGSHDVLRWFASQPIPALALAGRRRGLPMAGAGPDKSGALRDAMRRLVDHGHQRIVLLVPEDRRKPVPGRFEQCFLDELKALGIQPGSYHLPDWQTSRKSFHRRLDLLFTHTPPTAVILDEMPFFIAAQNHLAQQGITAPRDVSLICTDPHPAFEMCQPTVAHIAWDPRPVVRRIVRWANNLANGRTDRRQSFSKAVYVDGGTVGPAPQAPVKQA